MKESLIKLNSMTDDQISMEKIFEIQNKDMRKFISILAKENDISKIIDKGRKYSENIGNENTVKNIFSKIK